VLKLENRGKEEWRRKVIYSRDSLVFRVHPDTSLRIGLIESRDLAAERIPWFPVGLGALDAALAPPAFSRFCHHQAHLVSRMGNMAMIAIDSVRHARVGNIGLSADAA